MNNLSRNNHYLSQMYLEAWKNENNKVEVYELLVSNDNVPKWQPKSIKSVGSLDSIFVRLSNGIESDDIEKWFNEKYETPAKVALNHAINDKRITIDEWHKLIDFTACHAVRTPAFLIKTLELGKNSQKILDEVMRAVSLLKKEDILSSKEKLKCNDNKLFPFKGTNLGQVDENHVLYKTETFIGKQFFLWNVKNTLEETAAVLHNHKWGIMTVDKNVSLPTSDNPVICLNYVNDKNYDFNGGWGRKHCNILFPISPKKILYTEVGVKVKPRCQLDLKTSLMLKKMIIEHSHRNIISNFKDEEIEKIKPRFVSEEEFKKEKKMWEDFQKNYLEKEIDYIR